MVAKHGPASLDHFHRDQTEACRPRPIALLIENRLVSINKITWWMPGDKTILIAFENDENYLRVSDHDGKIDAALQRLFQVVTP